MSDTGYAKGQCNLYTHKHAVCSETVSCTPGTNTNLIDHSMCDEWKS